MITIEYDLGSKAQKCFDLITSNVFLSKVVILEKKLYFELQVQKISKQRSRYKLFSSMHNIKCEELDQINRETPNDAYEGLTLDVDQLKILELILMKALDG